MNQLEQIVVVSLRADVTEIEHTVVASVVARDGTPVVAAGDTERITPVRSSVKSLQALPLVQSGAADRYDVSPLELALASASHSGEPGHAAAIDAWLERLGLDQSHLLCGQARPMAAAQSHLTPQWAFRQTAAKHDCSGKHCGFLTIASHLGADVSTYLDPDGAVQILVLDAMAQRFDIARTKLTLGTDGCGAPVPCVRVSTLARGMATMIDPAPGSSERRITDAIAANPWHIAGTGRFDTAATTALTGRGYVKVGADGVRVAVLHDLGIAIALKCVSGSHPATATAMGEILIGLGEVQRSALASAHDLSVTNNAGVPVGEIVAHGVAELVAAVPKASK